MLIDVATLVRNNAAVHDPLASSVPSGATAQANPVAHELSALRRDETGASNAAAAVVSPPSHPPPAYSPRGWTDSIGPATNLPISAAAAAAAARVPAPATGTTTTTTTTSTSTATFTSTIAATAVLQSSPRVMEAGGASRAAAGKGLDLNRRMFRLLAIVAMGSGLVLVWIVLGQRFYAGKERVEEGSI